MVLNLVAIWTVARAEARLAWAKHDSETDFSTKRADHPVEVPTKAMDDWSNAEQHLARVEPRTTLGAAVLLQAVADIVATQKTDPELNFAEGPVLEIILNVARALSRKEMRLGK